jgi:hypothetical protein
MRFMMFMIPQEYQPDAPPEQKAGEGFVPRPEAVAAMMKFNEDLAHAEAGNLVEVRQVFEVSEFPPDVQKAAENPTVQKQLGKQKKL